MVTDVARAVVAVARENGIVLVAAGLAFYLVNALVPLFVFVTIAVTTFGWAESLLSLMAPAFGVDTETVISGTEDVLGDGTRRRNAALLAGGILGWSALTMLQSVNMAFGHIYGVRGNRTPVQTILEASLILVTVVVAAALLLVVHVGLAVSMGAPGATVAGVPLLVGGLFGVFVPMFVRFAPPEVSLREALPGAVLAAISWTAGAIGFRLYASASHGVQLYGVAGGVMVLLTWVYLAALALLVGVVLNAVLADRVDPDDHWTIEA